MYEQQSQNDNSSQDRQYQTNQDSSAHNNSYTYSFTQGSYQQPSQAPHKFHSTQIVFAVATVLLCVSLSFAAAFGGTFLANAFNGNAQNSDSNITPAPDGDGLYHEDPSAILDRTENEESIYGSAGPEAFAVSSVVRMVEDAVVVINAVVQTGQGLGSGAASSSAGSGVIISNTGYILTCYHVVENASSVTVTLNSGSQYAAALVGYDATSDLAVIKISPKDSEPLTYAKHGRSDYLVPGEQVVAIGNPLGILGGTVTSGIISATERVVTTSDGTKMTILQTDAAINSGNSGGGLFNLDGELVGIVNAKYTSAEGLAFAIPIDSAYVVEQDLIQYGYVRGVIDHGLELLDITSENVRYYWYYYQIDTPGVYVVSSKFNEHLQNKDRIVSVNGTQVTTISDFDAVFENLKVGDTVTIRYVQGGTEKETTITLREYVPDRISQDIEQ